MCGTNVLRDFSVQIQNFDKLIERVGSGTA
jgi:hypothetical protein